LLLEAGHRKRIGIALVAFAAGFLPWYLDMPWVGMMIAGAVVRAASNSIGGDLTTKGAVAETNYER